ncbi:hypothetical protein M422DRAFT_220011 [Sphaerobolus stellatus SS14]|nr:hypothetical protein M422DRAFT_220011 [Sphaerobolus stellatus SS14]
MSSPHQNDDPSSVFSDLELPSASRPVSSQSTIPDPFQLDDPDDSDSDRSPTPFGATSQLTIVPAETDVPLQTEADLPPSRSPYGNVNGNVNLSEPPFTAQSEEVEEENEPQIPRLYIPGLVVPGLFQPIHATDPLSTLLVKYVSDPTQRPLRDFSGAWRDKDFHTLVMTNSWRALAQMACERIVNSTPTELEHILELWYLRLSCLARLRLFNQTSSECQNLFAVLNSVEPAASREYLFDNVLPFELEVIYARLRYWAGDHLGYLDALMALLSKCKRKARESQDALTPTTWKERGTRVSLTIASQLIEMKDITAAARLLEPLCQNGNGSPALLSAIARIYLQGGHLAGASRYFAMVDVHPETDAITKEMNKALEAVALGGWDVAIQALRSVLDVQPDNALAANNLAVALLSSGKVSEGIEVMEKVLQASPLAVTATEPWLFNLSTLYELRSSIAWKKKRQLLIDVAKWSGDGLKASCLKLPPV